MRNSIRICLFAGVLGLALPAVSAADDYVVIVNKDNGNEASADFVAKAYRGEAKSWAGGGNVMTVALPEESATRGAFDKAVLGKAPAQSRAMWAQLAFSGKAVPPKMVETDAEVIKAVSESKNAIGYVSPKADVSAVKVFK
jgi:ABC-type phosphate transport system substrate-binding protein